MALVAESFWHRLRYTRLRDVLRGRVDGSLGWRRVVTEAELPEELETTITEVVKKTRLWNRERCDVASELAAHFKDGLEAGVSGEALVKSFGEVDQAAKLIRRSKRRCRPLWWQAWWWVSRTIAGLVTFYLLMVGLLAFDKPVVSTNYLETINRPYAAVSEQQRAWPHYLAALERLKLVTAPSIVIEDAENQTVENWLTGPADGELLKNYHELTAVEREVVDEWLDEREEFLAMVRKAAAHEQLGLESGVYTPRYQQLFKVDYSEGIPGLEAPVIYVLLPHVQAMRGMSRMLLADFYRSISAKDGNRALADIQALLGIARHSGDGPWLVNGLVKCAILNKTATCLEEVFDNQAELWTDRQLAGLAHQLITIPLDVNDYVEGERIAFYDVVQRLYSDNGAGDGYLTGEGIKQLDREFGPMVETSPRNPFSEWQYRAIAPASYFVAASRKEILAKHRELWGKLTAEAERPLWDPLPEDEAILDWFNQTSLVEKYQYAPLMILIPAFRSATVAFEKANGRLEGVLCGIALELYRREHGDWPESMARLAPQWLPRVPVDRINGGELEYRIEGDKPVVYSLGRDGDDDGGVLPKSCRGESENCRVESPAENIQPNEDGDWVIWDLRNLE